MANFVVNTAKDLIKNKMYEEKYATPYDLIEREGITLRQMLSDIAGKLLKLDFSRYIYPRHKDFEADLKAYGLEECARVIEHWQPTIKEVLDYVVEFNEATARRFPYKTLYHLIRLPLGFEEYNPSSERYRAIYPEIMSDSGNAIQRARDILDSSDYAVQRLVLLAYIIVVRLIRCIEEGTYIDSWRIDKFSTQNTFANWLAEQVTYNNTKIVTYTTCVDAAVFRIAVMLRYVSTLTALLYDINPDVTGARLREARQPFGGWLSLPKGH